MTDSRPPDKPPAPPVRAGLVVGPGTMHHVGRVVQHLTVGLLDEMFALTVVAPAQADVSNLPAPPVELLRHAAPRLPLLRRRGLEQLALRLERQEVDVLLALDATAHELTVRLSDLTGRPYMVGVLGLEQARRLGPLGAHCRAVLAASDALQAELLARRTAPADRIQLVRPGVHQTRTPHCFANSSRSVAVLAGGAADGYAPLAGVLESFAALREQDYDCVFFLLGAAEAEHGLRGRARELGLMHHVTFVDRPPQPQLLSILKAADVFVFPQSDGNLEVEVLEAMAAGLPVLIGGPCVGDFVIDTETALSYDAASSADLTAKLRVLLDDHELARRLSERALAHLRTNHSPARMAGAVAELCRRHALHARTIKLS